jgi:DNA-binding CsgD family transcriptional regulator
MQRAVYTGRYLDGLHLVNELTALARNEESVLGEDLLRPLVSIHLCWGDLAAARASAEEGIRLAKQSGVPALELFHDLLLAMVDVFAGDWQAALRRMFDDLGLAQRVGFTRAAAFGLAGQGLVFVRRGRLDEAADRVSEARRLFGGWSAADRHVFGLVDLVEGMIALARHEMDEAVAIAADIAAQNLGFAPQALALLGEAQATAGDVAAVQHTASRLATLGPGAPYPTALAAWVSGLAAGARRDPPRAVGALDQLDRAIAGFAELGMPYEEAVARVDRALVRHATGEPADAVAGDVNGALEVLDRLQAKPQADRARAVLRQLGRRPAASGDHEQRLLSAREDEVARLVAQGLSNAEIGERLFITTRTVATHLQHIYRRLELPSRAALIRYVLEDSPAAAVTSRGRADT